MNETPEKDTGNSGGDMFEQFPHISNEMLLLFVDGELSGRDVAQVGEHLEACWSCRVRRNRIEEFIEDVVDCRDFIVKPYLPPSPVGRSVFIAHLNQYAKKIGRPSLLNRLTGVLHAAMAPRRRTAWISLAMAASACLFLLLKMHFAPTVSAAELLQRAETSEISSLRASGPAVVYQKVRITTARRTVERELYRDAEERRRLKSQPVAADIAPISAELEKAGVNWNAPLSAASFQDWHDRQDPRFDRVWRTGKNLVTLTTTVESGPISNESFTVRESDFHPVKRTIEMKDKGRFEIEEVNYAMLNWNGVNMALFEPLQPAPFAAPVPVPPIAALRPIAPAPVLPTLVQLDDAEMAVRFALHRVGADLAPIQVSMDNRQESSAVVIQGLVSSDERKQELLQSLSGIPYIKTSLQTAEEAASQNPPSASQTTVTSEPKSAETHSPIEKQLREYFDSSEALESFSEHALTVVESLVIHAAALRQLEERYPGLQPNVSLPLSSSSWELLEAMVRDHRNAMRNETVELDGLLRPVLLMVASPSAEVAESDSLFDSAQRTERLILHLLFGAELPGSSGKTEQPGQSARELLQELQRLGNQLKPQE